jgi:methionyl-tRNA synthetase
MEITNADFEKINLRVGTIKAVKPHPKTKDYLLLIDTIGADKQLIANLKESYTMDELIGKQVVFVQNTEPVVIGGLESIGLLLVTRKDGKPVLITPEKEVTEGVPVVGLNNAEIRYHE